MEESAAKPCVDGCQGEWITAAKEILDSNGIIDKERFSSAVFDALKRSHFPAPKNVMTRDIILDTNTPFFVTSDAP